ncbi:IPT/TIG domain-containing protein [Flagellimonas nanhaiensis]|nr:IPT/TIG domain-containing protein [Allomuricauda nanhaiensis]
MKKYLSYFFMCLGLGLMVLACSKDDDKPSESNSPTIESFSPELGVENTLVTITGTNFATTTSGNLVKFNGVTAVVTSASATQIITSVPNGATTGKITVKVGDNTATSTKDFTVTEIINIELDKSTLELFTFESETLVLTGAGDNTVEWSSDDETVLTVDENGKVTAVGAGSATITAKVMENSATCTVTVNPNVYAAGSKDDYNAICWKNGEPVELTDGSTESRASSVFVSEEGDVFIGGRIWDNGNGKYVGMVWKNGEELYSIDDAFDVSVSSIFVDSNGDVFTAGYMEDENSDKHALITKNGTQLYLNENESEAYDLWVDGDVIYTGTEKDTDTNRDVAKVWSNGGELYSMKGDTEGIHADTYARSIDVYGNDDVYVAGYSSFTEIEEQIGFIWKNGQEIYSLFEGGLANKFYSMAINGETGDIYTTGLASGIGKVWENGQEYYTFNEGNGTSYGRSVFGFQSDLYVGGSEFNGNIKEGKVYKNNELIYKFSGDNGSAEVNSIFVK